MIEVAQTELSRSERVMRQSRVGAFAIATDAASWQTFLACGTRAGELALHSEVRVLARNVLRRAGYEVLEAENAGAALLLCEQHGDEIHLLLTYVVMPLVGGRQLANRLRTIRPRMKVLYMSGYTDDAALRLGIRDDDVQFLAKPFTPAVLAKKVRLVLDTEQGDPPSG